MKGAPALVALTALGLFGCALLARLSLFALFFPFDGLYGQDAFAQYETAQALQRAIANLRLPGPSAWPLGYAALLASAFAVAGASALTAQGVTLAAGALAAPLAYLWTRDLSHFAHLEARTDGAPAQPSSGGSPAGGTPLPTSPIANAGAVAAGLAAALGGQAAQSSLVVAPDAPALCWAMLGALAFTRYARTRRAAWISAAALAFTLAALTHWVYGVPALLCVPAFLLLQRGVPPMRWRSHAGLALALALPLLLAQWLAPSALSLPGDWHPANAFAREFENANGRTTYAVPPALFYAALPARDLFLTPLLIPFALLGAWRLRRAPRALQLLVFGWIALVYLSLAGFRAEDARLGLALWIPLVVLAGTGFDAAWHARLGSGREGRTAGDALRRRGGAIGRLVWRAALCIVAAGALLGTAGAGRDALAPIVRAQGEQLAVVRATVAAVPADGTVITLGMGGYFRRLAPDLHTLELSIQSPQTLERFACAATPTFLLIEPGGVAEQGPVSAAGENVRFLRERIGLKEAARLGAFALYRVGGGCA